MRRILGENLGPENTEFTFDPEKEPYEGEDSEVPTKKVSRREFLKTLGRIGAAVAASSFIETEGAEKVSSYEASKNPEKTKLIYEFSEHYKNVVLKTKDIKSRRMFLDRLRKNMEDENITLDEMDVETKRERDIRHFRSIYTKSLKELNSKKRKNMLEAVEAGLKNADIEIQDLKLCKDHEDILRLLPIEEQLDNSIRINVGYGTMTVSYFPDHLEDLLVKKGLAQQYLDFYYSERREYYDESKKNTTDASEELQAFLVHHRFSDDRYLYDIDKKNEPNFFEYLKQVEREKNPDSFHK